MSILEKLLSPASIDLPFLKLEGPFIVIALGVLGFVFLFVWSLIWLYRDARQRGKNGLVAILFILLTGWPVAFIWWFWLRPNRCLDRSNRAPEETNPSSISSPRQPV